MKPIRFVSRISRPFFAIFSGMASCAGSFAADAPAKYVRHASELVTEVSLNKDGGVVSVPKTGSVLDGIRVIFPTGALDKQVSIKLIRETGALKLKSGENSNAFLRLDAGDIKEFSRPIEIEVIFDRERVGSRMIQGYAIDDKGLLSPVSMKSMDRPNGKVVFSTMIPLLLTWVITSK